MWARFKMRIAKYMMGKIGFLPIHSAISFEGNTILIDGNRLSQEQAVQLKESAKNILHSSARRFVQDRMRYLAVDMALNKASSFEQIFFARAAIWNQEQEDALYRLMAQEESEPLG